MVSVGVIKVTHRKVGAEGDYVEAHNAFVRWDQGSEKEEKSFLQLQKLIKKRPELHPCYDHQIGQNLLILSDVDRAVIHTARALNRTQQPYYSDYAKTSLKISKGEYAEALQEAKHLKESLLTRSDKSYSTLFAFNLMRIATLCQELGDTTEELSAWGEIKRYGGWGEEGTSVGEAITTHMSGLEQLLHHFTLQETTLKDYIREREEKIVK